MSRRHRRITIGQIAGFVLIGLFVAALGYLIFGVDHRDESTRVILGKLLGAVVLTAIVGCPIALPAALSRRGIMSIGRWLIAATFALTIAFLSGFFFWLMAFEAGVHSETNAYAIAASGSGLVLFLSILSIPGCLLAAAVYPKRQGDA